MSAMIIKSREANDLKLTAYHGHFATRHSHNSHYLDITRMKHESRPHQRVSKCGRAA